MFTGHERELHGSHHPFGQQQLHGAPDELGRISPENGDLM